MSATNSPPRATEAWVIVAVLVVALLVRVVWIETIPGNFMLDEADNAQDAYSILLGRGEGIAGLDWSKAPLFSMYLIAACIAVFGDSVAGVRSMPIVLSTLSLIPFFLLARRRVGVLAAASAGVLLATSLWYLHFSRTAWINMTAPLFALWTVYFLAKALEHGRYRDYVLCGVLIALGTYGYPAGRSIPIAVAAALPVALLIQPRRAARTVVGFAVALAVAAVLFAPHVLRIMRDTGPARLSSVSIFSVDEYMGEHNLAKIVAQQVGRNLAGFILLDANQMGRGLWAHYLPPERTVLDYATGVLFWTGLIIGVYQWRSTFLWWLFVFVPILTVQVFSKETPDAGRGLIVAPFMYLFVALAIEGVRALLARRSATVVTGLVLGGVALLAATNVREYLSWIQSAQALNERNPAVLLSEFHLWNRLLRADLAIGGRGFGVMEWRERIDDDGCKNGTLKGAVCRQAHDVTAAVENRAFEAPVVDERPLDHREDAVAAPSGPARAVRPSVVASTGDSAAERDQARRRDLKSLGHALDQLHAKGRRYPSTGGDVQSVCYYPDDAGCDLETELDPIPADPQGVGLDTGYWYRSDGNTYTLFAALEERAKPDERCPERPEHIGAPGDLICRRHP